MKGAEVIEGVIQAYHFAEADPFRATTHNKGIMNAISSVALACGQDWRAIESGAHSYASHERRYGSLTKWSKDEEGNLVGSIELPMAVGWLGGCKGPPRCTGECRTSRGRERGRAGQGDGGIWACPEPRSTACPGYCGNPSRSHEAARQEHGSHRWSRGRGG